MNEPDTNETLSIAIHKLTNLFALLGQLGWSIASQDSKNRNTYNLHGQAKESFKSTSTNRNKLLAHLNSYPEIEYLHENSQLVIWRQMKKSNAEKEDTNVPLSKRETETYKLLLDGHTQQEIAADLGISPRTVEKHIQNLYKKLNVHSYNELLAHS